IGGLMDKDQPGLDEIRLKGGLVRILIHSNSSAPNMSTFLARLNSLFRPSRPKGREPVPFHIKSISLEETSLDIINFKLEAFDRGFDYGKLRFRNLVADADHFYIRRDTVGFELNFLRGVESTSG